VFAEVPGAEPVELGWAGAVSAAFKGGGDADDAGWAMDALVVGAVEMVPEESFPGDNVFAGDAFAVVSVGAETGCAG
jgi:hypothetical protein